MDPWARFHSDRQRAFAANDAMAPLCTTANVDATGNAQLRTLVLRDVDGQLALFINATSPKWPHLQTQVSLLTYWPTVNLQYRLQCHTTEVAPEIVAASWQLRPPAPKQMDWFYTQHLAQSSEIESRQVLLEQVAAQQLPDPLQAPSSARGLLLQPFVIERLDLNQDNGIHDRRFNRLQNGSWTEKVLVP